MSYWPIEDADPIPAYYASFAPAGPEAGVLAGEVDCDVVVVGAGYTGLSAALHLAEAGARVVVVEAKEVGAGASSRNFGQVVPYLKHSQARVLKAFPGEVGERMVARVGRGPDVVFGLIERYGIACTARREGLLFAAHSAKGAAALEERTRYWQGRGERVEMHGAGETEALVGSRAYPACSVDYRGGTINPLAYARGLALAAVGLGVRLFTGTVVEGVAQEGAGWVVRAAGGMVRAGQVVLATNAYVTRGLWPGLRESIIPARGYQLVSAPLGENMRAGILPGGMPLTDTRRTHSGVRLHHDGRLHSSTLGPPFDMGGMPAVERLGTRIAGLFPQLGVLEWEYRWAGWIALSRDEYPHLHELAPGVWAGLGYSGRGIAAATLMGQDIACRVLGAGETTFPVTALRRWWAVPFARTGVAGAIAVHRVMDAWDEVRAR